MSLRRLPPGPPGACPLHRPWVPALAPGTSHRSARRASQIESRDVLITGTLVVASGPPSSPGGVPYPSFDHGVNDPSDIAGPLVTGLGNQGVDPL